MKRSTRNGLLGVVGTWFAVGLFCILMDVFGAGAILASMFAIWVSVAAFALCGGFDD